MLDDRKNFPTEDAKNAEEIIKKIDKVIIKGGGKKKIDETGKTCYFVVGKCALENHKGIAVWQTIHLMYI
jgi:hypothetical protein